MDSNLTTIQHINPNHVPTARIIGTSVYVILCVMGCTNVFIIGAAINKQRLRHSATNVLILNLSIADLLLVTSIPFALSLRWMKTWVFGLQMCRLYWTIEQSNKFASVIFITVLSYNRYVGVCRTTTAHPAHWTQSKSFSVAVIFIGWFSIIIILTPAILYAGLLEIGDRQLCLIKWPHENSLGNHTTISMDELIYSSFSFSLFYLVPLGLMLTFYTLVGIKLRRLTKKRRNLFVSSPNGSGNARFNSQFQRITNMIVAVGVFHWICWTPYWILNIMAVSGNIKFGPWLNKIYSIIHMLPYLNSAVNPVFYGVTNPQYRGFFLMLFPKKHSTESTMIVKQANYCVSTRSLSFNVPAKDVIARSNNYVAEKISMAKRDSICETEL